MEILWPDEDSDVVRRRLSVALATARAVLDPDSGTRPTTSSRPTTGPCGSN